MEHIDLSVLPLIVDDKVVTCVDYQVCQFCGFRLMRVETTIINDQQIVTRHCPICQQSNRQNESKSSPLLSDKYRLSNFDAWLASHSLDRETLEKHYHLKIEHFFDTPR